MALIVIKIEERGLIFVGVMLGVILSIWERHIDGQIYKVLFICTTVHMYV